MKKKTEKWTEIQRQCLGLYMSGSCGGPGWGNPGYYNAVWEISERKKVDGEVTEWRTRVVNGPAVRDYSEGYQALVSLYQIFLQRASKAKE